MTLTVPVNAELDSYDAEQDAITVLTRGMSPYTASLVRQTIQRAVDHGKALDVAQNDAVIASRAVQECGSPPKPGEWSEEIERYYEAVANESRSWARVDNLRRMLGGLA